MILLANEIIKHGNRLSTISNTLLNTVNGKKESLEYAIAHYKLIDTHILPDDLIKLFEMAVGAYDSKSDSNEVELDKELVYDFLDIKGDSRSKRLENALVDLQQHAVFTVRRKEDDGTETTITISPISSTSYNSASNKLKLRFDRDLLPYISMLHTLLDAVNGKEESLESAIARDKLIDMHILPDDPIVDPTDDYWDSFKPTVKQHRS